MTPKQKFIGDYLTKKMKFHNLPYGMTYLNLLADTEEKAERAWKRKLKKQFKEETNGKRKNIRRK